MQFRTRTSFFDSIDPERTLRSRDHCVAATAAKGRREISARERFQFFSSSGPKADTRCIYSRLLPRDSWKWGEKEHYKWRDHEGHGYWRGGAWIGL
jgi:hypothetical protein